MNLKKITKEEQENRLQLNAAKSLLKKKNTKPGFLYWVTNDKTAFKILLFSGLAGGVIVTLLLLILSLVFDFDIFFKLLFGGLLIWQCWNAYKSIKDHKYIDTTVNKMVYKKAVPT
jgi:hypothetical protein